MDTELTDLSIPASGVDLETRPWPRGSRPWPWFRCSILALTISPLLYCYGRGNISAQLSVDVDYALQLYILFNPNDVNVVGLGISPEPPPRTSLTSTRPPSTHRLLCTLES